MVNCTSALLILYSIEQKRKSSTNFHRKKDDGREKNVQQQRVSLVEKLSPIV